MDFSKQLDAIHSVFRHKFLEGNIPYDVAERYYKRKAIANKYNKTRKVKDNLLYVVNIQTVQYNKATPSRRRCMTAPHLTHEYNEYIKQQDKMQKIIEEFRKL